ncbi:MAG: barstar family protein [Bacteroidetes bacterium]|nr:barstar family protein [Bacteroidota bacterium]
MDLFPPNEVPPFPEGAFIAQIDGAKAQTLRAFYPRIAKQLIFPDYFGKNLDALSDCLCSLEVTGSRNVILLIRNFSLFLHKEKPERKSAALQVLQDAEIPANRYDGISFLVVGLN